MQKAGVKARAAGFGSSLPSGFEAQQETDLGEGYARAQDSSMLQRRLAGAQGLNPLGAATAAQGGNQSIMQAPLQNNFWSNLVLGLVKGSSDVASAYAAGA